MIIHKCDICKKTIKDRDSEVAASVGWSDYFIFCHDCGKSVVSFLKNIN